MRSRINFRSRARGRRAFSLLELIVVVVIIGLLASLVAISSRSILLASKRNAARAEMATIVKAIEAFYADQGRYPTNDEGLAILTQPTQDFPDGFLDKVPKDPWKNAYEYIVPGSSDPYEVVCLGADGAEGGDGGDADLSSESVDE